MPQSYPIDKITIISRLRSKLIELRNQPEFSWMNNTMNYAATIQGEPDVKLGIANCFLDFDLWKGLRNPAKVGLYPVSLEQIWEFWAHYHKHKSDDSGRSTIFQLPPTFESARGKYKRVLIISAMLPLNPEIFKAYNSSILKGRCAPPDIFRKAMTEVEELLSRSLTRLAFDLMQQNRAVVVMNRANVNKISKEVVPITHQDSSHGVCKNGNFPHKSIAALVGLGQFGVSRLIFRDEIVNGKVQRFTGPILSMFIFDMDDIVIDGTGGIVHLNEEWRERAMSLADFTVNDRSINKFRFCRYQPLEGENGCGLCIKYCPSGALKNSSPQSDGQYSERVKDQAYRFMNGALQFDNVKCCDERGQMAELYDEWACTKCFSICAGNGGKRYFAAENFENFISGSI
ncbi:MAG: hypothetical protein AAGU27_11865 [Dehalobacterium sp.]